MWFWIEPERDTVREIIQKIIPLLKESKGKLLPFFPAYFNLKEIVWRSDSDHNTWTVGYDKVFIYDKWLERGKKVRRYHRALFFNLFSRGQTALPGYKQIGIFGNIKYTHDQKYERTWLSHWLEYLQ